jgi:hypothetical protein
MDPRTYEINNLRILNDYLTQTIEVLARAQRLNCQSPGLSHSNWGQQSAFGVPGQTLEPQSLGLSHSPYAYPNAYGVQHPLAGQVGWGGAPQTFVDPFIAQRGLSHTGMTATPWNTWSPAAEIARQRELQSMLARQQYEAMCRSFMGI